MPNSTLKHSCLNFCLALLLFVVAAVAKAADFGPAPTTFSTTDLNGTYEVVFEACKQNSLDLHLLIETGYSLTDASGVVVPGSSVTVDMKDSYTMSFAVSNVANAAAGAYTIAVPAGAVAFMTYITNDAFDVTLNLSAGTDPVDPGTDPVDPGTDPEVKGNVATFALNAYKSSVSQYYREGDVIESDAAGITLKFNRTGMENATYSYCYSSNAGYTQFKDCQFTISAPAGTKIQKIEFEDGAPMSTTYDLDNFEASGYSDAVWTGNTESVTFATKELQIPIYSYDDDDNEYISGYTTSTSGARVSKIVVTLDKDVDHVGGEVDPVDPNPGGGEVDPVDPNPGGGEVDPVDPDPVDPVTPVDPEEEVADNVALFNFTKGIVYNVKGVTLTTDNEWNDYFEALQLFVSTTKPAVPATFTAPEGKIITEVRIVESQYANNYGFYYLWAGYEEGTFTIDGTEDAHELTFTGAARSITITADTTSALVAKAYVTFVEGNADGVESISTTVDNGVVYDLAGRRANATAKGVMIANGKKIIR